MRRRHGRLIGLAALVGCAPAQPADSAAPACWEDPPAAGQVRVKRIDCTSEVPRNGEARATDYLFQNALVSLVVRNTGSALTLVGAPGGTVVDFAPHGWNDRLLEAVPIVQGGWIAADEEDFGVDEAGAWLRLRGPVVSAIGLDTDGGLDAEVFEPGPIAELRYRLAPDSLVLQIEGAEGLYLHGDRLTEAVQGGFYHAGLAYLSDGVMVQDLGGAQRLEGVSALAVGLWAETPAALDPGGARASGVCAGERVEVRGEGGVLLGFLDPTFDGVLPAGARTLTCTAEGFAPGAPALIGEDLSLETGGEGWLWLRAADEAGEDLPALVTWSGGRFAVPPGGAPVPLGEGVHLLTISHGPAFYPETLSVTLSGEAEVSVVLRRAIAAGGWAQADLWREATPSRLTRVDPLDDLRFAAAEGARFVVQSAPDEVGLPYTTGWEALTLRARAGSIARTEQAGEVLTWSWSSNRRFSGHGATPWFGLGATDLLAAAMTAEQPDRIAAVDAAWVAAAGPPAGWDPRPDLLRLREVNDLPVLLELARRQVPIAVAGPVTWIYTGVEGQPSAAACEQGLVLGRSVASNGPLLTLEAVEQTLGPGTVFSMTLSAPYGAQIEAIELYIDGELWSRTPARRVDDEPLTLRSGSVERWTSAVAVAVGADWAVTSPLRAP